MTDDPLAIDAETMRAVGHRTLDWLVDEIGVLASGPVLRVAAPMELRRRLDHPPPAIGEGLDAILSSLAEDVIPFAVRWDHPRMMAYVPGSTTWPGALADFIAAACNLDAATWREGAGPSQVELTVIDWFKDWFGYPPDAAGIFVSGGSAANMTELACARESLLGTMSGKASIYVSDQTHSSIARAARVLGFRPEQVRVIPSDQRFRWRPDALEATMDADLRSGWRPLVVTAAAGSTNTGAVDPFPELAALCRERGVWFHIDAAYGGFAVLTERGGRILQAIELADSITVDPHKWLYQPFECGCLLVRDGDLLRQAFEIVPEYLADAHDERRVNFADRGMQLTRTSRALKAWVSLRYFGVNAFRDAIDRSLDLAKVAERLIQASEVLELLTPATLGIVTFRRRIDGDDEVLSERVNAAIVNELAAEGTGFLSSTRLRGRYAIRMCVLNHSTTEDDVETIIRRTERIDVSDLGEPTQVTAPASARDVGVAMPWMTKPRIDAEALRSLPFFSSLSLDQAEEVLGTSEERRVPEGTDVIEQWQYAREFFVILEGTAEARSEQQVLRILGPGDFFGELAAVDWGAGYGYVRTASVTSTSSMRLLVLSSEPFNRLVREVPQIAAMISNAKRERL